MLHPPSLWSFGRRPATSPRVRQTYFMKLNWNQKSCHSILFKPWMNLRPQVGDFAEMAALPSSGQDTGSETSWHLWAQLNEHLSALRFSVLLAFTSLCPRTHSSSQIYLGSVLPCNECGEERDRQTYIWILVPSFVESQFLHLSNGRNSPAFLTFPTIDYVGQGRNGLCKPELVRHTVPALADCI